MLTHTAMWRNPGNTVLSERSQMYNPTKCPERANPEIESRLVAVKG